MSRHPELRVSNRTETLNAMNGLVKHKLLAFLVTSECLVLVTNQECVSPQYLELGKSGSVICSFGEGFFGVYWYNSTDFRQDLPIIYLSRSEKGGTGYTTGEFDMFPNGSLLIHNVSLAHDRVFNVTFLQSQSDPQVRVDVRVVVIVTPTTPAPIILSCGGMSSAQNCLLDVNETMTLVCSVKDSRPAVDLKWTRRAGDGDAEISFKSETFSEGLYYTSHIATNVTFSDSFNLALFSCQANNPAGVLEKDESFILLKNANLNLAAFHHQTGKFVPRFSKLALVCTERKVHAFVWKRIIPSRHVSENILYAIEIDNTTVTTLNDEFLLGGTNSLILPRIDINDEGMYACISTDGTVENVALYSVSVIVQPVPSYPVVDGCSSDHCAVEVMRDGVLTCNIKGIRPEIQLKWSAFSETDEDVIVFSNHISHIREKDHLFDITLTVNYTVKKVSEDKMTVRCYGVGSNAVYFQLMTTVDLFFNESTIASKNGATFQHWWWIVPLTFVFIAIVIAILRLQRKGKQFASEQSADADEATVMIDVQSSEDPELSGKQVSTTQSCEAATDTEKIQKAITESSADPNQSDKRGLLIQQLQQRYEDLYNGVPLVPYRADELHCVESVYRKSAIDHLVSKERGHEKWEKVDSYKEIFLYNAKKSTRRILHGEPGYGKSIICLKVAYDWCNSNLEDIEILVLVHLKQLGGVNSIYTAIKSYILPKDTRLSEEDIADILGDCKSVLVIFDGFDEYPDQDASIVTDVKSIISRRMFQQFTIVITTRSSFTPTKYPPQTEIYRLTGFDEETRKKYICEMTNSKETAREVQSYLKEHLILQDLSQVPFLLACFVNMIQEGDDIKTAKSVTKVFERIVSCFHSHMRNKRMFEDIANMIHFELNMTILMR
ncbi:NACHT, LRR and PYD domains-containing protein 7 [Holothuria leucospilota]|uniref:NACHT, LRR and PYD domains-containing protein 7 n=1 Tax=Holothuria leucospilota TaxID=206669 RepID=A0A9Q0YUJ0_HOLLE|nr:NACHT, LRR and PYD domains-containing protein 7 [Holothuria leucospilota]